MFCKSKYCKKKYPIHDRWLVKQMPEVTSSHKITIETLRILF